MKNIEEFIDQSGLLLTRNVINSGISKDAFYHFVKNNGFEQVAHGVYVSPKTWADDTYILHIRCPAAVFSHEEAFFYHHLTEREPMQQTITLYTGYNTKKLRDDGIKVFTVKKNLLSVGKIFIINSFGHRIPVYDLERTICDLFRSRSYFAFQDFQTALKTYVNRTDKDLNKLMNYARQFRIYTQLRKYLEVLL